MNIRNNILKRYTKNFQIRNIALKIDYYQLNTKSRLLSTRNQ